MALAEGIQVRRKGGLTIIQLPPRSDMSAKAFDRMTQSEFTDLVSAVKNVIWQETGLDPEALLEGKSCSVAPV